MTQKYFRITFPRLSLRAIGLSFYDNDITAIDREVIAGILASWKIKKTRSY